MKGFTNIIWPPQLIQTSFVFYSDIFSLTGALSGKDSEIGSIYKYCTISNGMLTWNTYISSSVAQTKVGYANILNWKLDTNTFTDIAGHTWKTTYAGTGFASRTIATMYDSDNGDYLLTNTISHTWSNKPFVEMYISNAMLNKTGGLNIQIQIPLEFVE